MTQMEKKSKNVKNKWICEEKNEKTGMILRKIHKKKFFKDNKKNTG